MDILYFIICRSIGNRATIEMAKLCFNGLVIKKYYKM